MIENEKIALACKGSHHLVKYSENDKAQLVRAKTRTSGDRQLLDSSLARTRTARRSCMNGFYALQFHMYVVLPGCGLKDAMGFGYGESMMWMAAPRLLSVHADDEPTEALET